MLTNQQKLDRIRQMRDTGRKNADIAVACGMTPGELSRFLRACKDDGVSVPAPQIGAPRKLRAPLNVK